MLFPSQTRCWIPLLNQSIGKPVRSIFWDNEGTLWLGTKGEGILKIYDFSPLKHNMNYRTELINSQEGGLINNSVYAFAKSCRPMFWIGHAEIEKSGAFIRQKKSITCMPYMKRMIRFFG